MRKFNQRRTAVQRFVFRKNSRLSKNLDAQEIGEELKEIYDREKALTAEAVVSKAKSLDSSLHGAFTWDNSKAAIKCRLAEARYLIRSIDKIEFEYSESGKETVLSQSHEFAFVPSKKKSERGAYHTEATIISDPDKHDRALMQAIGFAQAAEAAVRELARWTKGDPKPPAIKKASDHLRKASESLASLRENPPL